jgi:hypothetical protein
MSRSSRSWRCERIVRRRDRPSEKIAEIADLLPRDVILAQALAAMQGPLAGFGGDTTGVLSTFIGTLQAIHDKKA